MMYLLGKLSVLCCCSLAETFRKVFEPCPKVAGDNKMVGDAFREDVSKIILAVTLARKLMVSMECPSVLSIYLQDACLMQVIQKWPPAALHGKRQMPVPCKLQEDGEAA